ncbi:ribosomal protein S5 domain 2-type protein, partial [Syncephalis pseudoplumigaleata]
QRYRQLVEEFVALYGRSPQYVVRAPGRVNLIGEHIDYAEFGVLPVALNRDIIVACSGSSDDSAATSSLDDTAMVQVASTQSMLYPADRFTVRSFDASGRRCAVEIDATQHQWSNYVKCGIRGVIERARATAIRGMSMLVDGTVPPGTGLSSSSALVVASAVATMAVHGWHFSRSELATTCMHAERYVGTNGGGMDQTCSLFAEKDHALFIRFKPALSAAPTPLPPGSAMVIVNSLVLSEKATNADHQFNMRVLETRLAARILARALGLLAPSSDDSDASTDEAALVGACTLRSVAQAWLARNGYADGGTACEDADALGRVLALTGELARVYLAGYPVAVDRLKLRDRARHVYSEAARVCRFRRICIEAADRDASAEQQHASKLLLGRLMNESHASCRDDYECSCPELDLLTEICRKHNAYGARLTGAGWGG